MTWWKRPHDADGATWTEHDAGSETPGDTDAADIVSRTGEEMPEVAHDSGQDHDTEPADDEADDEVKT